MTSTETLRRAGDGVDDVDPRRLAVGLSRATRIGQTYAPEHPMRGEALQLLERFFGADGETRKQTLVLCVGSRLAVNGRTLEEEEKGVAGLRDTLKKRGLRGLTLPAGLTGEEARALLTLFTSRPQDIDAAGGAAAFLQTKASAGRISLLEIPRERAVGRIDGADSERLREITVRFCSDTAPEIDAEEAALLHGFLSDPRALARLLAIASQVLNEHAACLPGRPSAIGLVEAMYRHLEGLGAYAGRAFPRELVDALRCANPETASALLREKLLQDPNPETLLGSDLEPAAKSEIAGQLTELHVQGGDVPADLAHAVSLLLPGEAGRQKLAALLHARLIDHGRDSQRIPADIADMLEGLGPTHSGREPIEQNVSDVLELVAVIAEYDYQRRYAYVLLELTMLSHGSFDLTSTMEPLLDTTRQALRAGDYGLVEDVVAGLREISESHSPSMEARALAHDACKTLAQSDEFSESIRGLDDETLREAEPVWGILEAMRPHLVDWILERTLRCSDGDVARRLAQLLVDQEDDVGAKLSAKLEGIRLSQSEALFDVLYHVDGNAFLRLCEKQLREQHLGAAVDVVQALGKLGDPAATGVLRIALRSSSLWMRQESVHALGQIGGPEATGILRDLAASRSHFGLRHEVRRAAVEALGITRDARAVPILRRILRKRFSLLARRNRELRLQAAIALGAIGTSDAFDILQKASRDRSPDIRRVAKEATFRDAWGSEGEERSTR